jgi:hypothetical protein
VEQIASGDGHPQGPLDVRLASGLSRARVEVIGQSGRRWTPVDAAPGPLERADSTLLDEIRGLRAAGGQVVALGTNDASWISRASADAERDRRRAWVLGRLAEAIDELDGSGVCTVLVTAAGEQGTTYGHGDPETFSDGLRAVNDYLRVRAGSDPDDGLVLWEWSREAATHHTNDAEPWFGPDTVHLNSAGQRAYADSLARAALRC